MSTVAIGTLVSNVSVGNVTETGDGVGLGPPAKTAEFTNKEAVMARIALFQLV
jgi:hypothetical protein